MQLHDPAQRIYTVIMRIRGNETGMTAIADVNGVNRRRAVGYRLPDANA